MAVGHAVTLDCEILLFNLLICRSFICLSFLASNSRLPNSLFIIKLIFLCRLFRTCINLIPNFLYLY